MRTIGTARQQLWPFRGVCVLYTVGRFAGPVVCLAVVTGNHYVVDTVVAIAVALAGYFAGQLPEKLAARRRLTGASRDGLAAQPA